MRLSIINFAGIARTLVAVGTESDASIDATTLPATPRSGSIVAALGVLKTGAGLTCACAGVGTVTCGVTGAATTGAGVADATGTGAACATGTGAACATGVATAGAGATCVTGAETFCAAFGTGGVPPFGADDANAGADVAGADTTDAEDATPGL